MALPSLVKRLRSWRHKRHVRKRLEAAFQRRQTLDRWLVQPILKKVSAQSGVQSGKFGRLKSLLKKTALLPLTLLESRLPSLRPWRVRLSRKLLIRLLSFGLQTLSSHSSRH